MMIANCPTATPYLSKTLYIHGLQCHKYLWLEKNRPELKDPISESQEAVFQSGTDVGMLAHDLFPGGIEIPYEGLPLMRISGFQERELLRFKYWWMQIAPAISNGGKYFPRRP